MNRARSIISSPAAMITASGGTSTDRTRAFLTIGLTVISIGLAAQNRPLRSNVGMAGGSGEHTSGGRHWYVQQVVGQASVAGSFQVDGRYYNQGFVQPLQQAVRGLPSTDLDALLFPNPFDDHFAIAFAEDPTGPVAVRMYNALGQLVYTADHPAQRSLLIRPAALTTGSYIVHVTVGHHRFIGAIQRL